MALTAILAGAGLGLSAVQAASTISQSRYGVAVADAQSKFAMQQSKYIQQQAGLKMSADDYNAAQLLGRLRVQGAAAGGAPELGSSEVLYETSAQQQRINDMFTKYSANIESANLQYEAELGKSEAKRAEEASYIEAGTGLISGGIRAYGAYSGKEDPFASFTTLPSGSTP